MKFYPPSYESTVAARVLEARARVGEIMSKPGYQTKLVKAQDDLIEAEQKLRACRDGRPY